MFVCITLNRGKKTIRVAGSEILLGQIHSGKMFYGDTEPWIVQQVEYFSTFDDAWYATEKR
jgi:hypothetical protein